MERNDDGIEEDNVLIPEWHSETRDDTGQDVEQLGGTIEFVVLVDQSEEALVDGLSNHLSAGHKLGVELMKDVLEVVSLDGLLGVEELEELLHELDCNINLQLLDINRLVDDELQEEFVNTLQVRPGGVHLIFLLDTSLRELQVGLLDVGQRTEDVLLNHGHDIIQVRNDQRSDRLLILEKRLHFVDSIQSLSLTLNITRLVLIVVGALADKQLFLETLLEKVLLVSVLRVRAVGTRGLALRRLGNLSLRVRLRACLVHFLHFSPNVL